MNEKILLVFLFVLFASMFLLLSKRGGVIANIIALILFITFSFLAFKQVEPMLYAEKIILYNDWNRYNGIIFILVSIFWGGVFAIIAKTKALVLSEVLSENI